MILFKIWQKLKNGLILGFCEIFRPNTKILDLTQNFIFKVCCSRDFAACVKKSNIFYFLTWPILCIICVGISFFGNKKHTKKTYI